MLTGVWFLRVVPAPLFEPWASNARAGRRTLLLRASGEDDIELDEDGKDPVLKFWAFKTEATKAWQEGRGGPA